MSTKINPLLWVAASKIVESIKWAAANPETVLKLSYDDASDIIEEWTDYLEDIFSQIGWIQLIDNTPEEQVVILLKIKDKLSPEASYTETCYLEYGQWYTMNDVKLELEVGYEPVAWMNIPI